MKVSFTKILNYLGLTIAFSAFAIIMIQVKWDTTFAKGYPDSDRLYRAELSVADDKYWVHCSRFLFDDFRSIPEVESIGTVQLEPIEWNVRRTDSPESVYLTRISNIYSTEGVKLLGVDIVEGSCVDGDSINRVLISTELAETLFPNESAVGKLIEKENDNTKTISGVFKPLLKNGITPDIDIIETIGKYGMSAYWFNYSCILTLCEGANISAVQEKLHTITTDFFTHSFYEDTKGIDTSKFKVRLTSVHDVHYITDTSHDSVQKSNVSTLYTLSSIAIILLLVAMINHLNISMAEVPTKMKSLNTRKVLGASQLELIWLQCHESLKVTLIAILSSIGIVYLISLTSIADLIDGSILPSDNIVFFTCLALVTIVVSILSGLYPSIYSTSFPPALVLKGNFSHSDHGRLLRNCLIGLQFIVSFILIIFAFFVEVQMDFMKNHDKGFRSNDVLLCQIPWGIASNNRAYQESLLRHPEITDVTFSAYGLGTTQKGTDYGMLTNYKNNSCDFDVMPVEYNFTDFFGINVIEGRPFRDSDLQSENGKLIYNEVAYKKWDIEIGTGMMINGNKSSEIVGIVNNYNFRPMQYAVSPIALYCISRKDNDFWNWTNIYIKRTPGTNVTEISDILFSEANKLDNSTTPDQFSVSYLDEQMGKLYEKEETLGNLVRLACLLSGIISIIGILGLVHYETQYRRKEVAIRRVLGGNIFGLLMKFNKLYIIIASICFLIIIPITCWIISQWLMDYPYQSPIPVWIFIAGFAILMTIIVLTVSVKCYRAATENPLNSLKSE